MATAVAEQPVVASPAEVEALRQLARRVRRDGLQATELVGPRAERLALPESVRRLLAHLILELADGRAVSILARGKDLTTHEAAALLNVSRPYLIKLLDNKTLPHHRVGKHRRIPAEAVLAYRARQQADQAAILAELTREAQDLGFYE